MRTALSRAVEEITAKSKLKPGSIHGDESARMLIFNLSRYRAAVSVARITSKEAVKRLIRAGIKRNEELEAKEIEEAQGKLL